MKKSEKRMMLILIIVAIIIITLLVNVRNKKMNTNIGQNEAIGQNGTILEGENKEFVKVLEDGTKMNISDKLAEPKTFSNYEISNIKLTEKDGESVITAEVKNVAEVKTDAVIVDISVLDKYENEILKYSGIISEAEPGGIVSLRAAATADFANAYDFTIQIAEEQ